MNKILIVIAAVALYWGVSNSDRVDMHASDVDASCSVVMFTTDWCPVCKSAKTYFNEQNYSYCEYDVEKDSYAHHLYTELEAQGVPAILIGDRMTVGFYPDKIDELISGLGN